MTKFPVEALINNTPAYYYDLDLLRETLNTINRCTKEHPYFVHYAVKANANPVLLNVIREAGLGIDCVSGYEVQTAIDAGFEPGKIAFAGVGKTDKEILLALHHKIGCFNVESLPEIDVINQLAGQVGVTANICIRVNPNIDAHTHKYITTGLSENKFGINLESLDDVIKHVKSCDNICLKGLHFHIGSQILNLEPFELLCDTINGIIKAFQAKGTTFEIINVGGGLGIDYDNPDANPIADFDTFFNIFNSKLQLSPNQEVHFELGRSIVAQCGSLIATVTYVKEGTEKKFVIVDAGMSDLIRPALYQAHHKIQNITAEEGSETDTYDVVGPICESADVFGTDEVLPITKRGDIIAIRSAGAYGEIMASRYNCRPFAKSVFSE